MALKKKQNIVSQELTFLDDIQLNKLLTGFTNIVVKPATTASIIRKNLILKLYDSLKHCKLKLSYSFKSKFMTDYIKHSDYVFYKPEIEVLINKEEIKDIIASYNGAFYAYRDCMFPELKCFGDSCHYNNTMPKTILNMLNPNINSYAKSNMPDFEFNLELFLNRPSKLNTNISEQKTKDIFNILKCNNLSEEDCYVLFRILNKNGKLKHFISRLNKVLQNT